MRRALFDDAHEDFRASCGRFLEREVKPSYHEGERDGIVPRELLVRAGAGGFLGMAAPERYGGPGVADFRLNLIIGEECASTPASAGSGSESRCTTTSASPSLLAYCDEEQRARWLPEITDRRLITAIAMTEPQTGSNLAGIATRPARGRRVCDGAGRSSVTLTRSLRLSSQALGLPQAFVAGTAMASAFTLGPAAPPATASATTRCRLSRRAAFKGHACQSLSRSFHCAAYSSNGSRPTEARRASSSFGFSIGHGVETPSRTPAIWVP